MYNVMSGRDKCFKEIRQDKEDERGSSLHPCPCNVHSTHHSHARSYFKDTDLRDQCAVETPWTVYVTEAR